MRTGCSYVAQIPDFEVSVDTIPFHRLCMSPVVLVQSQYTPVVYVPRSDEAFVLMLVVRILIKVLCHTQQSPDTVS